MDYTQYDHIIVAFSGGKDSMACVLHLIDDGAPMDRVELWHHDIDGHGEQFMDWPSTPDYCRKVADALHLPIYYSWKEGGFLREMLRDGTDTAPNYFETPSGAIDNNLARKRKSPGTRRKYPQVSGDLSVRWCSAYLKIDVCSTAIRGQDRFLNKKTLVVTGERAQESSGRAKYAEYEPDDSDNREGKNARRHVDHWRPVHKWTEEQVWAIMEKHRINPHPAYKLGWGRLSCAACIFGGPDQWASLHAIAPTMTTKIMGYEKEFGVTIERKMSVEDQIAKGTPYQMDQATIRSALYTEYTDPVIVDTWVLPQGAYKKTGGPM